MRKLMRSIARANMKAAGVGSMNRKHLFKDKDGNERKASFFFHLLAGLGERQSPCQEEARQEVQEGVIHA